VLQLGGVRSKSMEESSLFSGKVPLLVFEGCIKEIPGDVALRGRFLEALDKFPQTEALSAAILASIERDFPDDPAAYVARAAHRSRADPGAAHSLLLEGVAAVPTPGMYLAALSFLRALAASSPAAAASYAKLADGAVASPPDPPDPALAKELAGYLLMTSTPAAAATYLGGVLEGVPCPRAEEWAPVYGRPPRSEAKRKRGRARARPSAESARTGPPRKPRAPAPRLTRGSPGGGGALGRTRASAARPHARSAAHALGCTRARPHTPCPN
jgi:hypothetical protein